MCIYICFQLVKVKQQKNNMESNQTTKTIFVCRKKSGNYTISNYKADAWELVAEVSTPSQLKELVNSLGNATVIKSEYSQSQLTTKGSYYNHKDALRAFGLSTSEKSIKENF